MKDQIELDYERAILASAQRGDNDAAQELSVGLSQYRNLYKADDGGS